MELDQLQILGQCVGTANRLISDMQANKENISACVGDEIVRTYCDVMDSAINHMKQVRNNLVSLQQSSGG